ncbi:hypothetical protein RHSIM_RhsimUnG0182700 [Rhododendron simsii]|uniref:MATE efflux family protein n=1 Tax=Rhododendron simsii TaxID=118357 RepID=A0A834FUM1_RHOSS|nr:hypothetical protein RHSIM_RhsimUnG0182700 [Rhododendron simsii]
MEEEALLVLPEENERKVVGKWKEFVGEMKKVGSIATPMVVVTVSQYLLQVVSMSMAGHLGEISLSSAAIATSFTNVTGFSLLFGMAGALETLCGQAYGAEQYKKLGIYTYAAIVSLLLVCLPVSVLWIFLDKLLLVLGQDPLISQRAGKYAIWLIPALFPYAILQSIGNWFMYWLNVILLGFYVKYSSSVERTRTSFSRDVFLSTEEFIRFAVPSAIMVCLEWWSYELFILLSGLSPNPELETSVLSICLTTATLHFYIPYSFGAAASTRVSNELGAGNPEAARLAVWAVIALDAVEVTIASATLFCCRHILGRAFSNDKEVVDYVTDVAPLLCISIIMDSFQAVLSGNYCKGKGDEGKFACDSGSIE